MFYTFHLSQSPVSKSQYIYQCIYSINQLSSTFTRKALMIKYYRVRNFITVHILIYLTILVVVP